MAVESDCTGMAGVSNESECTGMATDVARTGLVDMSLDFERTNLAVDYKCTDMTVAPTKWNGLPSDEAALHLASWMQLAALLVSTRDRLAMRRRRTRECQPLSAVRAVALAKLAATPRPKQVAAKFTVGSSV